MAVEASGARHHGRSWGYAGQTSPTIYEASMMEFVPTERAEEEAFVSSMVRRAGSIRVPRAVPAAPQDVPGHQPAAVAMPVPEAAAPAGPPAAAAPTAPVVDDPPLVALSEPPAVGLRRAASMGSAGPSPGWALTADLLDSAVADRAARGAGGGGGAELEASAHAAAGPAPKPPPPRAPSQPCRPGGPASRRARSCMVGPIAHALRGGRRPQVRGRSSGAGHRNHVVFRATEVIGDKDEPEHAMPTGQMLGADDTDAQFSKMGSAVSGALAPTAPAHPKPGSSSRRAHQRLLLTGAPDSSAASP